MAYKGRILARSPYYVTATGTALDSATLTVWVWSGTSASKPVDATYVIEKKALVSGATEIVFEISELIRDYFDHNRDAYDDAYTTFADCLWVETTLSVIDNGTIQVNIDDSYLAQDGYGYFDEGVNPLPLPYDGDFTYYVMSGEDIRLPVLSGTETVEINKYYFFDVNGLAYSEQTLPTDTTSQSRIQYITQSQVIDMAYVDLANSIGGVQQRVYFVQLEPCEYPQKEVKYYDKNGALAITYMTAKDVKGISTSRNHYQKDLGVYGSSYSYDTSKHQKSTINLTASENITLSSSWVDETQTEVYKQILLSKLVWIDDAPVSITSNNITYQTRKNDKLISYTLSFDYAYNEINNIY